MTELGLTIEIGLWIIAGVINMVFLLWLTAEAADMTCGGAFLWFLFFLGLEIVIVGEAQQLYLIYA